MSEQREPNILIATPHGGDVSPLWVDAFIGLDKPIHAATGTPAWARASVVRSEVALARNRLVRMLLDTPQASHILFWDDDVLAPPDGLMRLAAHNLPIVSGFYTSRIPPIQPICYTRMPGKRHRYQPVLPVEPGLHRVDGIGFGFVLIQRAVFERIKAPWFQFICGTQRDNHRSEDFYFCEKALAAGYQIALDFDVQCGHVGKYIFDDGDIDQATLGPVVMG
jgi:hypothetical protein